MAALLLAIPGSYRDLFVPERLGRIYSFFVERRFPFDVPRRRPVLASEATAGS